MIHRGAHIRERAARESSRRRELTKTAPIEYYPGHVRAQTFGLDLRSSGDSLQGSPLAWRGPISPPLPSREADGYAGWAVGPATAWVEVEHTRRSGERYFDYHDMYGSVVMLTPVVHRSIHDDFGRQLRSHQWQWLGIDGGELRLDQRRCEPAWPDERDKPPP